MSLSNLLAVGRSFIGIKDGPCRYKLRKQHQLPTFGRYAPTPEGSKTMQSFPKGRPGSEVGECGVGEDPIRAAGGQGMLNLFARATASVSSFLNRGETQAHSTPAAPPAVHSGTLIGLVNPATSPDSAAFGGRFRIRSTVRSKPVLVQAELGFESVKVVRNDLSESDLEVVPAKLVPTDTAASPFSAGERPSPSGRGAAWQQAIARWFGAGRARA